MTTTYLTKRMDPSAKYPLLIPDFEPRKINNFYFPKVAKILKSSQNTLPALSTPLFTLTNSFFHKFDRRPEVQKFSTELFKILFQDLPLKAKTLREDLTKKADEIQKGPFNRLKNIGLLELEAHLNYAIENKKQTSGDCPKKEVTRLQQKFGRSAYIFERFVGNLPKTLERSTRKIIDLRLKLLQKNFIQEKRKLLLYAIKRPLSFLFLEEAIETYMKDRTPLPLKKYEPKLPFWKKPIISKEPELEDLYSTDIKDLLNDSSIKGSSDLTNHLFTLTHSYFGKYDESPEVQKPFKKIYTILFKEQNHSNLKEKLSQAIEEIKGPFNQIKNQVLSNLKEDLQNRIKKERGKFFHRHYDQSLSTETNRIHQKFSRAKARFKRFLDKLPNKLRTHASKIIDRALNLLKKNPSLNNLNEQEFIEYCVLIYALQKPLGFLHLEELIPQIHYEEFLRVEKQKNEEKLY